MKRRAKTSSLVHNAFPEQGTVQPNHMGSMSMAPNAPTTPEMMAPQSPDYMGMQQ